MRDHIEDIISGGVSQLTGRKATLSICTKANGKLGTKTQLQEVEVNWKSNEDGACGKGTHQAKR